MILGMLPEAFGKYTLLSRLGMGGMAEVFLARTQSLGGFQKLLAIKRLLPFCTQDQETVDLLADEARITVRLTHPHIVQVFDFGRVKDSYYIAMEYVDGLDLKSLIRVDELNSSPMELKLAFYVTSCLLDALDFAHTQRDANRSLGIIHRDVSPHNVLISRHGQVKLTDFGVARAAISSHVSRVGDIRGKFSYMPPEQVYGASIDQRVDLFAVGAILYELLSGKQPYRSASAGEQLQLLRAEVQRPSLLRPDLSPKLDAICLRALDKDPDRRFATAAEFGAALRDEMVRILGVTLPPSDALAELVELRLSQLADRQAEPSDLMALGDYSATDDSLIAAQAAAGRPRRGGRGEQPAADAPRPRERRQTRRDLAVPQPASNVLVHHETDPQPRLQSFQTDVQAVSDPPLDDELETMVAFRVPDRILTEELQVADGGSREIIPLPRREVRDRRILDTDEAPAASSLQPVPSASIRTNVADSPFGEYGFDDPSVDTRDGTVAADPIVVLPREDEVPAPRQSPGLAQIAIVLVASFVVGVALAVMLATC